MIIDHPNKTTGQHLLESCVSSNIRLVTDTEVFQEILHRYDAIQRKDAIQPAFDTLTGIVDAIFPIKYGDVLTAKDIMFSYARLSSRDALHLAVMSRRDIRGNGIFKSVT